LVLPESKVKEIIEKSGGGEVVLDLAAIDGVTEVVLTCSALDAFASVADVTIKLPSGSVTLDVSAIASIIGQAVSDELMVVVKPVAALSLTAAQQNAVKAGRLVPDINIMSGGRKIRVFDGSLAIQVPYTGLQTVAVWHLNNAGEMEKLVCTFTNGIVAFTLNHLSLYVVGPDAVWLILFPTLKSLIGFTPLYNMSMKTD